MVIIDNILIIVIILIDIYINNNLNTMNDGPTLTVINLPKKRRGPDCYFSLYTYILYFYGKTLNNNN